MNDRRVVVLLAAVLLLVAAVIALTISLLLDDSVAPHCHYRSDVTTSDVELCRL